MKVTMKSVVLGLVVAFAASSVMAQTTATVNATITGDGGITAVTGTAGAVNAAATGAAGGYTFDLSLDSSSDILVIDATLMDVTGGTVFNDTDPSHAASDHAPPVPALLAVFGDLNADLWITTPGGTSAADASSIVAGDTVSHFDTTDDGAQSGFQFASLTLVPDSKDVPEASATLMATIQTAATPTPLFDEVTVSLAVTSVPEPASFGLVMTALLGGLGLVRRKRN